MRGVRASRAVEARPDDPSRGHDGDVTSLDPLQLPDDGDAVAAFLSGQVWPFHGQHRRSAQQVRQDLAAHRFDGLGHRAFWVVEEGERVGLAVVDDLNDPTVMFDLRLDQRHRGRGIGTRALAALAARVFETWPHVERIEAVTRVDNLAMRRVLVHCGFVKEAHYRAGWPVPGGAPMAAVGYALLRRDHEHGTTTAVDFDDLGW